MPLGTSESESCSESESAPMRCARERYLMYMRRAACMAAHHLARHGSGRGQTATRPWRWEGAGGRRAHDSLLKSWQRPPA